MADRILGHFTAYRPDLIKAFVTIQQRDGDTALHWAARSGSRYYCEVLLEYGANVATKNNAQKTAIDFGRTALASTNQKLSDARINVQAESRRRTRNQDAIARWTTEVSRLGAAKGKIEDTIQYLEQKLRAAQRASAERR